MFTNKDIMELRKMTGVGIMDCKKALKEKKGNMDEAVKYLREKGMASAEKRAGKIASQGIVDAYVHFNGSVGVLIEVNCETDFVARSEQFKSFVHDLTMQIAASNPKYISSDDITEEHIQAEKEIILAQMKNEGLDKKPPKILEKIVTGKLNSQLKEFCLLEQKLFKDDSKTVKDYLNETIATIGEKIKIRRFVRFEMGEGLEKRKDDLANEVEEQIAKMKGDKKPAKSKKTTAKKSTTTKKKATTKKTKKTTKK